MTPQTREQHIKREKQLPTSVTAQALLATMASFYAVYRPEGIKNIAKRIHSIATWLNKALARLGYVRHNEIFFDTLRFSLPDHVSAAKLRTIALSKEVNLCYYDNGDVNIQHR